MVALAAYLVHILLLLQFPYQLEYAEGPVLEFSTMLARGEPLYVDPYQEPPRSCIYAPLHMALSSLLIGRDTPSFFDGRLIAALAWAGVLAGMALSLRSLQILPAWLFFLVSPLVAGWTGVNRIDMLALAFSVWGLALVSRRNDRKTDVLAALCFALAFLTKQSFVSAPAAAGLWRLWQNRAGGLFFCGVFAGLVGLELWSLNAWSAGVAYTVMFKNNALTASVFLPDQMTYFYLHYLASVAVLIGLVLCGGFKRQPVWALFSLLSAAFALGVGRLGGYYNYFLELHAGLAVLGALSLDRRTILWGLGLLQLGLAAWKDLPPTLYSPFNYLRYETLRVAQGRYPRYLNLSLETELMRPWLDSARGRPLLAENLGNPLVMGYRVWMCDPVYYFFLARVGKWDENQLVERVKKAEFGVILLQETSGNLRFSPRVVQAVLERYQKVQQASVDSVYVPKK